MLTSLSCSSLAKGPRFSLLLLQDGEEYVDDFVAECNWPAEVAGNKSGKAQLAGSLRLASRSILFDPDDARIPIVRLPLGSVESLETTGTSEIVLSSTKSTRMKPGGADVPYVTDVYRPAVTWQFTLSFAAMADVMPLAQVLLAASRLPARERETTLASVLEMREGTLRFDPGHLRGSLASERILFEAKARLVAPLTRERAALALSTARLYAQPQHDIVGRSVRSAPLGSIAYVARRRSTLQDVGLEVFFVDDSWGGPSAFVVFDSLDERERFLTKLLFALAVSRTTDEKNDGSSSSSTTWQGRESQTESRAQLSPRMGGPLPSAHPSSSPFLIEPGSEALLRATCAWQHGALSNLEYLLFLNFAGGRSFADLAQYPVFPWVLADYESEVLDLEDASSFRDLTKPVGALNKSRLDAAWARYQEMGDHLDEPPFLYGSHYSCPAYVLYWLVREAPAHMLRLQNGRFDAPDRLFSSVAGSWKGVLNHPADVKELIPEFFMSSGTDFLVNRLGLALGKRQNGQPVGDVELPPWAKSSPVAFLRLHRTALEAPYVSANLHHWIDLIFGYKQRGTEALKAGNVFRAVTYEGGVDIDSSDPCEAALLRLQIEEYGQAPRQLFQGPHPRRLVAPRALGCNDAQDAPPSFAHLAAVCCGWEDGSESRLSMQRDNITSGDRKSSTLSPEKIQSDLDILAELEVQPKPLIVVTEDAPQATQPPEVDQHPSIVIDQTSAATNEEEDESKATSSSASWTAVGRSWGRSLRSPKLDTLVNSALQSKSGRAVRSLFDRRFPQLRQQGANDEEEEEKDDKEHQLQEQAVEENTSAASMGEVVGEKGDNDDGNDSQEENSQTSTRLSSVTEEEESLCEEDLSALLAPSPERQTGDEATLLLTGPARNAERAWWEEGEAGPASWPRCSITRAEESTEELSVAPLRRARVGNGIAALQYLKMEEPEGGTTLTAHGSEREGITRELIAAATQSGEVRLFDLPDLGQVRSLQLSAQPLICLACPPVPHRGTLLAGGYDGLVHVYSFETASVLGGWAPGDDAVSALCTLGSAVITGDASGNLAAWDWHRQFWKMKSPGQVQQQLLPPTQPAVQTFVGLQGEGIWGLAANRQTLLAGTDGGSVLSWDVRAGASPVWQTPLSPDAVSAVRWLSNDLAVVGSTDGRLRMLDVRRSGTVLAVSALGVPVLALDVASSNVVLAGDEEGSLWSWQPMELGRAQAQFSQRPVSRDAGLSAVLALPTLGHPTGRVVLGTERGDLDLLQVSG